MGASFIRLDFPFRKPCDQCHQLRKSLYKVPLSDNLTVFVCSSQCAEVSRANYQEKIDKNITPGQPVIKVDENEMLEDNI